MKKNREAVRAELADAAHGLGLAAQKLNREEAPCEHCGLKKREDWVEFQTAQEIDSVIRKLNKLYSRLGEA